MYVFHVGLHSKRRDGDSNPGTALDGYTLSRRASSATRASLQTGHSLKFCASYNIFLT